MNIPFMILFNKMGLPMYYGNLVATMIGYGITIFICLKDLKEEFNIDYNQTVKDLFSTIGICIIMVIVLFLLKNILPIDDVSRIKSIFIVSIYALIGIIIYGIITYKLGMFNRIIGFRFKRKK